MSRRNPAIGDMQCEGCGHQVAIRQTGTGKLSWSCDGCDMSVFAVATSKAGKRWSAKMVKRADDPGPDPVPKPEAKKKAGGFSLGNL